MPYKYYGTNSLASVQYSKFTYNFSEIITKPCKVWLQNSVSYEFHNNRSKSLALTTGNPDYRIVKPEDIDLLAQ